MLHKFLFRILLTQLLFQQSTAQTGSCPIDSMSAINECTSNPCTNAQCVDGYNRYMCYCNSNASGKNCYKVIPGYMYEGTNCEEYYYQMTHDFSVSYGTPLPNENGPYIINYLQKFKPAFCDFSVSGQQWTVIQRRTGCEVSFYRTWTDYQLGFGNASGDYWLGNDDINVLITRYQQYQSQKTILRIELTDWSGNTCYQEYNDFEISDASDKYRLISVGPTTGTCGDSLSYHVGKQFSTYDQDNDASSTQNCAQVNNGAWWYNSCLQSNLNGPYVNGASSVTQGIIWQTGKGLSYSYKTAIMKIKMASSPYAAYG